MKGLAKKVTSVIVVAAMLGSLVGCSKDSDKSKSSGGVTDAANSVMEALVSCDSKKLKKNGAFSEETLDLVNRMQESEAVSAVMEKATFTVDEDSIKESKKSTSVKVEVSLPDSAAALDEAAGSLDDFRDAIEGQKEKDYTKVALTLKFEGEDDEVTLSNGDEIVSDFFSAGLEDVASAFDGEKSVPTTSEADVTPEPTDTTPTTEPTDTTPEPSIETDPPAASSAEYDVVCYQDANVVIHFIKIDSDGVHFKVENLTDVELTIQANSFSVDGISIMDTIMSEKIPAKTTGDALMKIESPIPFGSQISTVSGELKVIDWDNNLDSYEAHFDTTTIDSTIPPAAPAATGVLLYEDATVKIYYKELVSEGAVFEVENLTTQNLEVRVNSVALNGKNFTDPHFYGNKVAPHSIGDVLVKDDVDASEAIGQVSAQFEIADPAQTFDTFYATINTTVVDANVSVEAPVIEGAPVYEDANVRINYKALSDKGIVFMIENLTDHDFIVQAESLSYNRIGLLEAFLSLHTAPHSVCEVVALGDVDPSATVGTIGGSLIIADPENRKENYMIHLDNIVVDASVDVSVNPTGKLVYEDDKVKVYFKEAQEKGLVFEVENLTEYGITIQASDLMINGTEATGVYMSDGVAPHALGQILVHCKEAQANPISTLSCDLTIFSWDGKVDTYHAVFTDVSVA